jgi:hypothetical protein
MKCYYIKLKLACCVLWVQLELLGPFFSETLNSHWCVSCNLTQFLNTCLRWGKLHLCSAKQCKSSHHKQFRVLFTELFFSGRRMSRGLWPPHSPDLNPYKFYLWGMLKDKVSEKEHSRCNVFSSASRNCVCCIRCMSACGWKQSEPHFLNVVSINLKMKCNILSKMQQDVTNNIC